MTISANVGVFTNIDDTRCVIAIGYTLGDNRLFFVGENTNKGEEHIICLLDVQPNYFYQSDGDRQTGKQKKPPDFTPGGFLHYYNFIA